MGAIQEIFQRFAPEYLTRFGEQIPYQHHRVIEAICQCRTEAMGSVCYQCEDCGQPHLVPAACGNRHCPQCQQPKSQQWLARQLQRQLPGHHFMVTFTVPEALRMFLRSHPSLYDALFQASSQAIKTLVRDPRFVGGDQAGFFGVLHTWGRQLHYHPHIHYVVPGGALSSQDGAWHAASPGFFVPVKALSRIFRGKFRDRMHQVGLLNQIPSETWQQDWNVNCQAVPSAEDSIRYLAPYVFKVAIADHRILKIEANAVSFSYKKPGSARLRTLTLDPLEFIRRFLQHVLPRGFMKVRYYGFLSPSAKVPIADLKAKVELAFGFTLTVPDVEQPPYWPPACQACGGRLRFQRSMRTRRPLSISRSAGPPGLTCTCPTPR